MAREQGIPCLFTVHNVHTVKTSLAAIEDRGIDAAYFWQNLYFDTMATNYEHIRDTNPVDLLTSGIFGAHFVNVVSPTFLQEIIDGQHPFVEPPIRHELINKVNADCAAGILNAPDPSFDPTTDEDLAQKFGPADHTAGKKENKRYLQKELGLIQDDQRPAIFLAIAAGSGSKGMSAVGGHFLFGNFELLGSESADRFRRQWRLSDDLSGHR